MHSFSKEPVRDEAAEDAELRPREEEEEMPPWVEETQQAWVVLGWHQGVCRQIQDIDKGCNKLLLCITVKLVHKIMRVVYAHCFAFQYACNTQCVAGGGMFCHIWDVCQKRHNIMRSDGSTLEFRIPSS